MSKEKKNKIASETDNFKFRPNKEYVYIYIAIDKEIFSNKYHKKHTHTQMKNNSSIKPYDLLNGFCALSFGV